jgi:hypothetical protein
MSDDGHQCDNDDDGQSLLCFMITHFSFRIAGSTGAWYAQFLALQTYQH